MDGVGDEGRHQPVTHGVRVQAVVGHLGLQHALWISQGGRVVEVGKTTIPAEAEEADATDKKAPLSPEEIPKTPGLTPAPGLEPSADELDVPIRGEKLEVSSQMSDGVIEWHTSATLEMPSYLATETLVTSASGNIEAATWPMGSGRVIACSSPDIFSAAPFGRR